MFTHFSLLVWLVTVGGVLVVVAFDMAIIARRSRTITIREAMRWVGFYVGLAAVFAVVLWVLRPGPAAGQFVAGYLTEYSLSVDNLFVFVIIMSRFAVPPLAQDKALYIGIAGSMLLRTAFIVAGAGALALANWVFYIFAAFLLYTAVRLVVGADTEADFRENAAVRVLGRVIPTTSDYHGKKVFTRSARRTRATPLLIVIASISIANVVFALDSLPAIFGLTQDTYIIVSANAFALMGLRQLFFIIGDLLDRLAYLNTGLAGILAFIGMKLTFEALHGSHIDAVGPVPVPSIGILTSLLVITGALVLTAAASVIADAVKRRRTVAGLATQPAHAVHATDSAVPTGPTSQPDRHRRPATRPDPADRR